MLFPAQRIRGAYWLVTWLPTRLKKSSSSRRDADVWRRRWGNVNSEKPSKWWARKDSITWKEGSKLWVVKVMPARKCWLAQKEEYSLYIWGYMNVTGIQAAIKVSSKIYIKLDWSGDTSQMVRFFHSGISTATVWKVIWLVTTNFWTILHSKEEWANFSTSAYLCFLLPSTSLPSRPEKWKGDLQK